MRLRWFGVLLCALVVITSCRSPLPPPDFRECFTLHSSGRSLDGKAAAHLLKSLSDRPDSIRSRLQLLGFYSAHSGAPDSREIRRAQIVWIIKNTPESPAAAGDWAVPDASIDGADTFTAAQEAWDLRTRAPDASAAVHGNAAVFFATFDAARATNEYADATKKDPTNAEWPESLGRLLFIETKRASGDSARKLARQGWEAYEKSRALTTDELHRFYLLGELSWLAYEAGEIAAAEAAARDLLQLSTSFADDWNFGNAIHRGNLLLGEIALDRGDVSEAKRRLTAAGDTAGSPQLSTHGPEMRLARRLLLAGESAAVVDYLDACGRFWPSGSRLLDRWKATIKAAGTPDFGPFAR